MFAGVGAGAGGAGGGGGGRTAGEWDEDEEICGRRRAHLHVRVWPLPPSTHQSLRLLANLLTSNGANKFHTDLSAMGRSRNL
eukprot:768804-Hanusia_phi.AAC.4